MKNKRNCNVNVILAKCKCVEDIFAKNSGNSVTRLSVLMLPGCGCTGTAITAALWVDGSVDCEDLMAAYMQAPNDGGLVVEWHFDEGSGNSLNDSSGNGNDGAIYAQHG